MDAEQDCLVAVLPPFDSRAALWVEFFGRPHVPVLREDPDFTAFPDGTKLFCYFVDFASCDWLKPRLIEAIARRPQAKNGQAVSKMIELGIYPIIADNVTVVRAPRRLWSEFRAASQDEENGPAGNGS